MIQILEQVFTFANLYNINLSTYFLETTKYRNCKYKQDYKHKGPYALASLHVHVYIKVAYI